MSTLRDHESASILQCKGFVNSVSQVPKSGADENEKLYFARLGIVTGREQFGDALRDRIQFVNVLISKRLRAFASNIVENARLDDSMTSVADKDVPGYLFSGVLCHFTIEDLHFSIYEEDKADGGVQPHLSSKGILTSLRFE